MPDSNIKRPYVDQFNVGVTHEIARGTCGTFRISDRAKHALQGDYWQDRRWYVEWTTEAELRERLFVVLQRFEFHVCHRHVLRCASSRLLIGRCGGSPGLRCRGGRRIIIAAVANVDHRCKHDRQRHKEIRLPTRLRIHAAVLK